MGRRKATEQRPNESKPPEQPKRRGRRKKVLAVQPPEPAAGQPPLDEAAEEQPPATPAALSAPVPEPEPAPVAAPEPLPPEPEPAPVAAPEPLPPEQVATTPKLAKATDLSEAEQELARKYPKTDIVEGSLAPAGAFSDFGQMRTVEIRCVNCGALRRIATSDLHHVTQCRACKDRSRKEARKKPESKGEGRE
ncbi:MAG: hypothetical protein IT429_10865 [Gemmataceae bacterium]|nr:hypothetical protein [Gemmataceae bacterium]